jgi:hypothetical protein
MKKIIKLTESDLVRLVKKVLNEQTTSTNNVSTGVAKKAADMFCSALGKGLDDKEDIALQAVEMLKTGKDVEEFATLVEKKEGKSLYNFFNEYMSGADPEYYKITEHLKSVTYKYNPKNVLDLEDKGSFNNFLRIVRQTVQGKREN